MDFKDWLIKNWAAALLLLAGICACVATFFLSKQDQKQKDAIENLGKENKKLTTETNKLSTINNQIGTKVESLTKQNQDLIGKVDTLVTESKALIETINERSAKEAAENLSTGELKMRFTKRFNDNDFVVSIIGGNPGGQPISWIKQGAQPFMVGDKSLMNLKIDADNKMVISMNVYDVYGHLIAEIVDNNWRPNRNFTGKFNYNDTSFEVINNQGEVAVSVDFLSDNKIVLKGIFAFRNDNVIILAGEKLRTLSFNDTYEYYVQSLEDANIKQIFRYTGKNWLGARIH